MNNLFDRNALFQTRWDWFVFLIVEVFDYVRLTSIIFDCWTVWLLKVRLCSIGNLFLWVRLSSITETNQAIGFDWVRLPNVRLTMSGLYKITCHESYLDTVKNILKKLNQLENLVRIIFLNFFSCVVRGVCYICKSFVFHSGKTCSNNAVIYLFQTI